MYCTLYDVFLYCSPTNYNSHNKTVSKPNVVVISHVFLSRYQYLNSIFPKILNQEYNYIHALFKNQICVLEIQLQGC